MEKQITRSLALTKLNGLSSTALEEISRNLTKQLTHFFILHPDLMTQIGGAYLPLENEIAADFNYLTHHLSLKLSYPIKTLEGMGFAMSAEPLGKLWLSEPYEVVSPQWLLVPGLAFSLKGERLGRGGGYYDRYLERYIPVRIALTYSALICDNIPVESHDALMDFIITENFCWDVYQQKKI